MSALYPGSGCDYVHVTQTPSSPRAQQIMTPPSRRAIEFVTLSKVTLRGWPYPAENRGPSIILSAGARMRLCETQKRHKVQYSAVQHNMPNGVVVPGIAEWYQRRSFTAPTFDTFGIGSSEILFIREARRVGGPVQFTVLTYAGLPTRRPGSKRSLLT